MSKLNDHQEINPGIQTITCEAITDSLELAKVFGIQHQAVLRSVYYCQKELKTELRFALSSHLIENTNYKDTKKTQKRSEKVDITGFGLSLLLPYINTRKIYRAGAEAKG